MGRSCSALPTNWRKKRQSFRSSAPVVILRIRNMTAIDATGLHSLEVFSDRLKKAGKTLLLCGARDQPRKLLEQSEFVEHIGEKNILPHVEAAFAAGQRKSRGLRRHRQQIAQDYSTHAPV